MNQSGHLYGMAFLALWAHTLHAQVYTGFGGSPYAGAYAVRTNPAGAAGMKYKWVVSLGELDAKVHNNYLSTQMPYHPYRLVANNYPDSLRTEYKNPVWKWNWLSLNRNSNTVNLYSFFRVAGPSAFVNVGPHGFGISTEVSLFAYLSGMPAKMANQLMDNLINKRSQTMDTGNFLTGNGQFALNIKQQAWASIGFTYAYQWKINRHQQLTSGITYKLLHGLGGFNLQLEAADVVEIKDQRLRINVPSFQVQSLMPRNNVFYPKGYGGIDLGVQFQESKLATRRKNQASKLHPDYVYKLGLAILDIGNLVYTRTMTTWMKPDKSAIEFPSAKDLIGMSPDVIRDRLNESLQAAKNIAPETVYGKKVKIGLPTRLVLQGDLQIYKRFNIDLLMSQNLRRKLSTNIHTVSFLAISPRLERRHYTLSVPLTLDNDYHNLTLGLYVRVWYLYFGTRNLNALLNPHNKFSADAFMGVQFGNIIGRFLDKKGSYMFFRKNKCSEF